MKTILITGANSYIGTSFEKYAKENFPNEFRIDTIDMTDANWRENDFSFYDCVFHVAGLANVDMGKVSEEIKRKYYAVNTDLAIETCKKAKADGVKQFVFMSSVIIYGNSAPYGKSKIITKDTMPDPTSIYGESKWKADKGVREEADQSFNVTVLRSPMIYGKGSKGNYAILAMMAKKLWVFPDCVNSRSMLYIENLCEFLCQIMMRNYGGVFWPQNAEYSRTSDVIREMARVGNHKILVSKAFNWVVALASHIPGRICDLANKAFGNLTIEKSLSTYDFAYQKYSLIESIRKTEK